MKKRLQNSYESYNPHISVRDGSWAESQAAPLEQKMHSFSVELVHKLLDYEDLAGSQAILAAVILQGLSSKIHQNKTDGVMNKMGITWVRESLDEMNHTFTYMSRKQIEKMLVKLANNSILERGVFNDYAFDRTGWYTIWNNEIRILCGLPPLVFQRVYAEV